MAKYMRKKEKLKSQRKLWNGINSTDLNPSIINNGWTFFFDFDCPKRLFWLVTAMPVRLVLCTEWSTMTGSCLTTSLLWWRLSLSGWSGDFSPISTNNNKCCGGWWGDGVHGVGHSRPRGLRPVKFFELWVKSITSHIVFITLGWGL